MLNFNLIAAISENFGIGVKGELPWRLKSELKYFSSTTRRCLDRKKQNVVIMGRKTYFAIPEDKRPLSDRLNVVLSTTLKTTDLPENVLLYRNLETAMEHLEQSDLSQQIETVWLIGGGGVYKEAIVSPRCNRIYLTKILRQFECDTFFPEIPADFQEVELDQEIPMGIQEEGGVQYEYKILEKRKRK